VGLTAVQTNMGDTEFPIIAGAYVGAILPSIVIFALLQALVHARLAGRRAQVLRSGVGLRQSTGGPHDDGLEAASGTSSRREVLIRLVGNHPAV